MDSQVEMWLDRKKEPWQGAVGRLWGPYALGLPASVLRTDECSISRSGAGEGLCSEQGLSTYCGQGSERISV